MTVARRVGIAGIASLIGGILVLGVGGRLAMRLSGAMALASDPATRFMRTGDGFQVGRITIDGTVGLVIFGGVFGSIVAAAFWALLKDRLPTERQLLWAGIAAAAIGGNFLVHADNIDFVILQPVWVNVVLYPVLAGAAGVVIVAVDRRLTRRFSSSKTTNGVLAAVAAFGVSVVLLLVISAGGEDAFLAAELGVLAGVAVPFWVAESRGKAPARWAVRLAPPAATAVITVEWVRLARSAASILG